MPLFCGIGANPNGVNLSQLFIMFFGKYRTVLLRDHPCTIVKTSRNQRIPGTVIQLNLQIYYKLQGLITSRYARFEADVIIHGLFLDGVGLGVESVYPLVSVKPFLSVGLILMHRPLGYFRFPLKAMIHNKRNTVLRKLLRAGF